jgi:hypothetical protein
MRRTINPRHTRETNMRFTRKLNVQVQGTPAARTTRLPVAVTAALAAGIVAASAMTLTPRAAAHDNGRGRACSERTLRADYGGLASGVRLVPFGPNAGKTEMIISTSRRTYDGAGGFTESGADLHGQLTGVTVDTGGIFGTYEVNGDCTGTSTRYVPGVPFPIVSNFVIVESGRAVKEAVMTPTANVVTVLWDRQ